MKKVFRKIVSVLMAFVVLFTTMSFTVDLHYCGDSLVDFSFFTKVKRCGMEKAEAVERCENSIINKKSCCADQKIVKQGQNDLKTSFSKLTFKQHSFVASFVYSYIHHFEGFDNDLIPFKAYSPPFVKRNIQVLYEIYII